MPHYKVVLRAGEETETEFNSGSAFVVAGDDIEIEGEQWRVESVEEDDVERLVCVPVPESD